MNNNQYYVCDKGHVYVKEVDNKYLKVYEKEESGVLSYVKFKGETRPAEKIIK